MGGDQKNHDGELRGAVTPKAGSPDNEVRPGRTPASLFAVARPQRNVAECPERDIP